MGRKKAGTVRIIGGRWRGRRLPVPDLPGLRPSGDRSRETLFNWLAPHVHGSRCADLFAGTGVLGLEAASRGAKSVVLVEKAPAAAEVIRANVDKLMSGDGRSEVTVLKTDALDWLRSCESGSLDIVFVDPPFGAGLEPPVLEILAVGECLTQAGLVYLETARNSGEFLPGKDWFTVKEKTVGDVHMRLMKKV